jgi:hypothetical protein
MSARLPVPADGPRFWLLDLVEVDGERRAILCRVRADAGGTWHRCRMGLDIPLGALPALLEGLRAGVATSAAGGAPRALEAA